MRREEYEELLFKRKKAGRSLTRMKEEASAQKILKQNNLMGNLFGEGLRELSESDRQKLTTACFTIAGFREFLKPYFERRVNEDYPRDFEGHEKVFMDFSDGKISLEELTRRLSSFRLVLGQHIDWDYGEQLKYHGNQKLREQYLELNASGSVFSLGRLFRDLVSMPR